MREHRTFTAEFKKELVGRALYRSIPISQLSHEHNIARALIYRWIREYQKTGEVKSTYSHSQRKHLLSPPEEKGVHPAPLLVFLSLLLIQNVLIYLDPQVKYITIISSYLSSPKADSLYQN